MSEEASTITIGVSRPEMNGPNLAPRITIENMLIHFYIILPVIFRIDRQVDNMRWGRSSRIGTYCS